VCQVSPHISGCVEPIECFPEESYWPRLGVVPAELCEEHCDDVREVDGDHSLTTALVAEIGS